MKEIMFNKDIVIRNIDKENKRDLAFISVMCRTSGRDMQLDFFDLSTDKFIQTLINFPALRIVTYKDEYVGFVWLDGFAYNLRAYIHGIINQFDKDGKKTQKYYRLVIRNRVMEQILEYYFKFYDGNVQYNLECIEAENPSYLQNKFINGRIKDLPTRKLLISAGFIMITNHPRRNAFRKNGRPCETFLYQIQKNWLLSWLETEREYIAIGCAVSELARKFNKKESSIEQRIKQKKLRRK